MALNATIYNFTVGLSDVDRGVYETLALKAVPPLAGFVAELTGTEVRTIDTRIGAGSDYNVFLDYLGIPIADFRFEGPYEAYHTARDDHEWVSRVADPGFLVHARLARLWSVAALRLANADLLCAQTRVDAQRRTRTAESQP